MLQHVRDPGPSIEASTLDAFERKYGLGLPAAYRRFLLKSNGGRPCPSNFPIAGLDKNPYGSIQVFYGLGTTPRAVDLNVVLDELQAPTVPRGILPIACTGYEADELVLDLRDQGAPVKFFDSIPFWGNNIWKESYLYPVADNFDALLASLMTNEEVGLPSV